MNKNSSLTPQHIKTNENVKEMVMNDRRITIKEVDADVSLSIGSWRDIFSMF